MDKEGFCKIVGRSKDMIIRGGENIYPAELEDFFHTHPQVQEVQVRPWPGQPGRDPPGKRGEPVMSAAPLRPEGGGREGPQDGGRDLCLYPAEERGDHHGGGDQSFLQGEGG